MLHELGQSLSFVKSWHELMTVLDSKSADLGNSNKTP
jgi:hypothetical protein